jgi:hypothetical protein
MPLAGCPLHIVKLTLFGAFSVHNTDRGATESQHHITIAP